MTTQELDKLSVKVREATRLKETFEAAGVLAEVLSDYLNSKNRASLLKEDLEEYVLHNLKYNSNYEDNLKPSVLRLLGEFDIAGKENELIEKLIDETTAKCAENKSAFQDYKI